MHDACPIVKNGTILREASCRVFPSAVLSMLLVALTADTHCHSHCALLCNCALVALSLHSLFSSLALSCSGRLGNLSRFLCYPLAHCSISRLLLVSTGIQISRSDNTLCHFTTTSFNHIPVSQVDTVYHSRHLHTNLQQYHVYHDPYPPSPGGVRSLPHLD